MSIQPGCEQEYRQRHDPIWSELSETLRAHGVLSYSIYLHPETRQLFAYAEIESEERWAAVAQTDVCQRWWQSMKHLMATNADGSPAALEIPEVFRL